MCGVGQKPSWHFATCHYEIASDGSGWWTVCWSNAWSLTHHTKVKCYGACLACKRATWFITLLPLHWQAKTYTVDWALKAKCWTTQLIFNSSMLHRTTAVCFGQKSTQNLCSFSFSLFSFYFLIFYTNHVLILHHIFKAWVGVGVGGLAGRREGQGWQKGAEELFQTYWDYGSTKRTNNPNHSCTDKRPIPSAYQVYSQHTESLKHVTPYRRRVNAMGVFPINTNSKCLPFRFCAMKVWLNSFHVMMY